MVMIWLRLAGIRATRRKSDVWRVMTSTGHYVTCRVALSKHGTVPNSAAQADSLSLPAWAIS